MTKNTATKDTATNKIDIHTTWCDKKTSLEYDVYIVIDDSGLSVQLWHQEEVDNQDNAAIIDLYDNKLQMLAQGSEKRIVVFDNLVDETDAGETPFELPRHTLRIYGDEKWTHLALNDL